MKAARVVTLIVLVLATLVFSFEIGSKADVASGCGGSGAAINCPSASFPALTLFYDASN